MEGSPFPEGKGRLADSSSLVATVIPSTDMCSEISLQNCRAPRSPPGYHLLHPTLVVYCPLAGVQAQKSMNDCNTNLIPLTFDSS